MSNFIFVMVFIRETLSALMCLYFFCLSEQKKKKRLPSVISWREELSHAMIIEKVRLSSYVQISKSRGEYVFLSHSHIFQSSHSVSYFLPVSLILHFCSHSHFPLVLYRLEVSPKPIVRP